MDYADDKCELLHNINDTAKTGNGVYLKINVAKMKGSLNPNADSNRSLKLNEMSIERIDEFLYLGSIVDDDTVKDVEIRIKKTNAFI